MPKSDCQKNIYLDDEISNSIAARELQANEIYHKCLDYLKGEKLGEAFKLTNEIKRLHIRLEGVDWIRAQFFLSKNQIYQAREALKEELRFFPDNQTAKDLLVKTGGELFEARLDNDGENEFLRFYKTIRPFTRLSHERARSIYDLARRVCEEDIPGDFVECGVAAGGSTMMLALVVKSYSKRSRKVYAFDTFTGMPDPGDEDTAKGVPADETGWGTGTCAAPENFVRKNCERIGVGDIVVTIAGLFEDTLPEFYLRNRNIALLHMDGDWYSSTRAILTNLFDRLETRALIQIDDYGAWDGCRKAIEEFSEEHGILFDLRVIDDTGRWCTKPVKQDNTFTEFRRDILSNFLNPHPLPDFADLYWTRSSILRSIKGFRPLLKGTFLDVGCGLMPYKSILTSAPSQIEKYIGLDINSEIYVADVDLRWDGKKIPLPDASIDCAMATEVLEHCPDPILVLREVRRVLKPGGLIFFTVPFIWPIHDAPHDYYRYTPFVLERLLKDADLEDIKLRALGGWNASLAQMIGLWLKRAPMSEQSRLQMTRQLIPLYNQLIESDVLPQNIQSGNTMATGWDGIAYAPEGKCANNVTIQPSDLSVCIVRAHAFNYSETFLDDHVRFLSQNAQVLYGFPFPHLTGANQSILSKSTTERIKTGTTDAERYQAYSHDLAIYLKKSGFEVVLAESGLMGSFVCGACERAGIPLVVHFHGADAFVHEMIENYRTLYQRFFRTAAALVVVSQAMRIQLLNLGAPPEKVVLAPYGVSIPENQIAEPCQAPPQFLAVGRFVEKKAPYNTIKAFARVYKEVPQAHLVMVGDGDLLKPCRELARKLNVDRGITFTGVLSRRSVARIMQMSRAFVQHSVIASNGDSEGLPLAVLEARRKRIACRGD